MTEISKNKKTCTTCAKKALSLICDLSYSELKILEKNRTEVNYKTGETIYKEGLNPYGLICLNAGKAKITVKAYNGNQIIVELKKPVDFLGFTEMMADEKYKTSAVALENSSVCIIDKNDFLKVVNANSNLSMKVMNFLAKELSAAHRKTIMLTQKTLKERLAEALLDVCNIYGVDSTLTLNTLMRRDDLASLAGMTLASASRTLSELEKERMVEFKGRKIKILNKKKLEETATNQQQ